MEIDKAGPGFTHGRGCQDDWGGDSKSTVAWKVNFVRFVCYLDFREVTINILNIAPTVKTWEFGNIPFPLLASKTPVNRKTALTLNKEELKRSLILQ